MFNKYNLIPNSKTLRLKKKSISEIMRFWPHT